MKALLFALALLVTSTTQGYQMGSAPFCVMLDSGELKCFYYTSRQCQTAAQSMGGMCVHNPNQ